MVSRMPARPSAERLRDDVEVGELRRPLEGLGHRRPYLLEPGLPALVTLAGACGLLALEDREEGHAARVLLVPQRERADETRPRLLGRAQLVDHLRHTFVLPWLHPHRDELCPHGRPCRRRPARTLSPWGRARGGTFATVEAPSGV